MRDGLRAMLDRSPRAVGVVLVLVRELYERWEAHDTRDRSAAVAFFGVLSVFPTLIALAALLGPLEAVAGAPLAETAEETVVSWTDAILTEKASRMSDAVRGLFERTQGGVLTFAVVAAVWAGSRGTSAVMRAIGDIYGVEDRRSWARRRGVALALLAGTVAALALALAMFTVGPLLGQGARLASGLGIEGAYLVLWRWLRYPLAFGAIAAWAAVAFHLAPDRHEGWRWDIPGALVTAALWVLVSIGFRLYLVTAAGANEVLGLLGGALILLVWLYLLSASLLIGAHVNQMRIERVVGGPPGAGAC